MSDTQLPSEEHCTDCGRAKHEHTPVEDFPCGQRTKDTLLDKLKRAIEAVPPRPDEDVPDESNVYEDWLSDWRAYNACFAKAWRVAFEWRDDFGDTPNRNCHCKSCRNECTAYDEGMALIREKLQS